MKLLRQAFLSFRQGNSDKVYEVDLCEVAPDQCVVNFRYGRRGSALRDGSKTVAPVSFAAAERIYEDLVGGKIAEGYQDASASPPATSSISPAPITAADIPAALVVSPRDAAVLARISHGHQPPRGRREPWSLSRAVWRAGELNLSEAAPLLVRLVGTGSKFLDYSIAWTLGRIGDAASISVLRSLQSNTRQPYMVRRMAAEAMLAISSGEARETLVNAFVKQLPGDFPRLVTEGSPEELRTALDNLLASGRPNDFRLLEAFYMVDNERTRPVLLQLLREAPLGRNYWQRFRHIFKSAEFRRDAEVFGILAWRFELSQASYQAFRPNTKAYLRRRVWRTLDRLGQAEDADYVKMATGVLLSFSDDDARRRSDTRYDWSNYVGRGRYQTFVVHWDDFGYAWAFNQILYGRSPRYTPIPSSLGFICKRSYQPGGPTPPDREESFAKLWEAQPAALLHLLAESRCRVVHEFAVKVLSDLPEFCARLGVPELKMMLSAPYEVTARFAFEQAQLRFDRSAPDRELVLAVVNCAYAPARDVARRWIDFDRAYYAADADFVFGLITTPFADTRNYSRAMLPGQLDHLPQPQTLAARVIAWLLALPETEAESAAAVAEVLQVVFAGVLQNLGEEVICDLLRHPLAPLQRLAGALILQHATFSKSPPPDIIQALLEASDPGVRQMGARIVDNLPPEALKDNPDVLLSLLAHPHEEVRRTIRDTVLRLTTEDESFAQKMVDQLIERLLTPGAPEGVPTFLSRLLREDLLESSRHVPAEQVWRLLRSRSDPAQEFGGALLARNIDLGAAPAEVLVELASHKMIAVRRTAWRVFEEQLDRIKKTLATAVKVLDSSWDDTRSWAFDFFRQRLAAEDFSPLVLISICDSVRPDVQQFGRELVTRFWNDGDGPEYLLKLSEHPASSLQMFVTNFLERYAAGNVSHLRELTPYFLTVLSQVNRGRVAKDRVLALLTSEAAKSAEAANVVADIVARQSATAAIGDRARLIEIMADIRRAYPDIALPLHVRPAPIRNQEPAHGV